MRYQLPDQNLFKRNREKLKALLPSGSLIILSSNDHMPVNGDGTFPYRQNSDLFYLTGIDQEETYLFMFPDFPDEKFREILLIKETSEHIKIWEGPKFTCEQASEISGVDQVKWNKHFQSIFDFMMTQGEQVYLNNNEHLRAGKHIKTGEDRLNDYCFDMYPLHTYSRLAPLMQKIRVQKEEEEIDLLRKACNITGQGFRKVLPWLKPGVMEYEVEAEILYEFIKSGSRGFAYDPIVGSGGNACILHYIQNHDMCRDGELLFMDVGAEYANYSADLSRAIPVNGKFTDRQKQVYNAVLHVQKEAMRMMKPGITMQQFRKEVGHIMEDQLIQLKLLKKEDVENQNPDQPLYKKYFMHGISHHLGLEVHDVGDPYQPFAPGMVFTVEPGIYIWEEQLGVRLENDVVIRENGVEDLMHNTPIEAEEIEDLMNQ